MAMHQDHFSVLSETVRLAAMALDAGRVHELGSDQWPVAMVAASLSAAEDESRRADLRRAYAVFMQKNGAQARAASVAQLARFVAANKGNGWRAFEPFAMLDFEAALRRKAAVYMATLAPVAGDARFAGVAELVCKLREDADAPVSMLEALLSLGDMRFLPLLESLYACEKQRVEHWLQVLDVVPNHLACQWLLGLLEAHTDLARYVTAALVRMGGKATVVIDLILPVPAWAYKSAAPQPLHGWTPSEYAERLQARLQEHLNAQLWQEVRAAFGA